MHLIIDIGNTSAKYVLYKDNEQHGTIMHTGHDLAGIADYAIKAWPSRAIMSTVVTLGCEAERELQSLPCPLLRLTSETPLPLPPSICYPIGMGVDRIAADVGAMCSDGKKNPVLVIDTGTCMTTELLHPTLGLLGGTISPGLNLRLRSMHEHTSALPLINPGIENDKALLGMNTETAMYKGALNSIAFEIDGYAERLRSTYPDLKVYLTGGDSFLVKSLLKQDVIQDNSLLLHGLNHILCYNASIKNI